MLLVEAEANASGRGCMCACGSWPRAVGRWASATTTGGRRLQVHSTMLRGRDGQVAIARMVGRHCTT